MFGFLQTTCFKFFIEIFTWCLKKVEFSWFFHEFWTRKFFSKNDPYRGNLLRGNQLRILLKRENASLTLVQGSVLQRKWKNSDFDRKTCCLEVFLCEKSIARVFETWKCFIVPDSGKGWVYSIEKDQWKLIKKSWFTREAFSNFERKSNRFLE